MASLFDSHNWESVITSLSELEQLMVDSGTPPRGFLDREVASKAFMVNPRPNVGLAAPKAPEQPQLDQDHGTPVTDHIKPVYYKHPDPFTYAFVHDLGPAETLCLKYITRWKQKDGIRDLRKARECLNRLINHESNKKL